MPSNDSSFFSVLFFLFFSLLVELGSGVLLWQAALSTFKMRWLLDEHAARGAGATATLCKQCMTGGGGSPRICNVERIYPCPEQAPEQSTSSSLTRHHYRKECIHVALLCCTEPHFDAPFIVKVLPGYQKLGMPKAFVDSRHGDYSGRRACVEALPLLFALCMSPAMMSMGFLDFEDRPPLLMDLKVALPLVAACFRLLLPANGLADGGRA